MQGLNLIGTTLGQYQILDELGRGGMAVVYKAWQASLRRHVAIKVMLPHLLDDWEFTQRFQQEAIVAANLNHPNIVTIYEVAQHENYSFIVMEYVEGESLEQKIISEGGLPLGRVINILRQVAEALDFAHQRQFIHRDIKPANILVTPENRAVISDFGIAKALEGSGATAKLTSTGTIIGSPAYMSPEQIVGQEVDYRTDLYSLGVVAYEMLSGQAPFDGSTTALLYAQVNNSPPRIRQLQPSLPAHVEPALACMLAKQPSDRYQNASTFVAALAGEVATDRKAPPIDRTTVIPQSNSPVQEQLPVDGIFPPPPRPGPSQVPDSVAYPQTIPGQKKRKLGTIIAVISTIMFLLGGAALYYFFLRPPTVEERLSEANTLLTTEQYEEALTAFNDVLERDPNNVTALTGLGQAHYARENFEKALTTYERVLQECSRKDCPVVQVFSAEIRLARSTAEMGEYAEALIALQEAVKSYNPSEDLMKASRADIEAMYRLLMMNMDIPHRMIANGDFEEGFSGWSLPAEKFNLVAETDELCAYQGQQGLLMEGPDDIYHNGPSTPIVSAQAGKYYVAGAMVHKFDESVELEGMYIGGRDVDGEYHGSRGPELTLKTAEWVPVVRLIHTPDWKSFRLTPILLTGEGSVCLDNVFVTPLVVPSATTRQAEAAALAEQGEFAQALVIYEDLLRECSETICSPEKTFLINIKVARAKAGIGKYNEALIKLQETINEYNPPPDSFNDVRPEMAEIYKILLETDNIPEHNVTNYSFEDELLGWTLPAEQYGLSTEVSEQCAYRGTYGLLMEGPDATYHNGPSIPLPAFRGKKYYAVGAMIRQIGEIVEGEGMYLAGYDGNEEYHGSQGIEIDEIGEEWVPVVRILQTPDWTDFRLSPFLLTGRGPVCVDEVFAMPLTGDE